MSDTGGARAGGTAAVAGPPRIAHVRELDGLRGLAIVLVLAFHTWAPRMRGGFIGVDLFFVLSGFLITSLLADEWQRTGTADLRRFYLRRALRPPRPDAFASR